MPGRIFDKKKAPAVPHGMRAKNVSVVNVLKKAHKQGKGQLLSDASKTKKTNCSKKLVHLFRDGAHRNILLADEKIFGVEQFLNKQNDRLHTSSKPNMIIKHTGCPETLMVFARTTAGRRILPIFVSQNIKINGSNYLNMLKNERLIWAQNTLWKQTVVFPIEQNSNLKI